MYSLLKKIQLIREKSLPQNDFKAAIKANSCLIDCLYRLSFTADKLTGAEVDNLVTQLQSHPNEVTVLLGRIVDVKKHGIELRYFQDIKSKEVELDQNELVLPKQAKDFPISK